MTQSTWTEEQIDQAKEMWANRATAQEIADAIGKSRNAVIGKMNRMNVRRQETIDGALGEPSSDPSASEQQDQSLRDAEKNLAPVYGRNSTSTDVVNSEAVFEHLREQRLPLMYLSNKTCRWPIGDPSTKNFWFCGKQSAIDKPYCAEHSELAFQNAPRTGVPDNSNAK